MLAGASSIALGLLFVVFLAVGLSIYLAVVWQIRARRTVSVPQAGDAPRKTFGLPEAFLAAALVCLISVNIYMALTRSVVPLSTRNLAENFFASVFVVFFVAAFLKLRRIDIDALAGFSRTSLKRAVSTGIILLLAAT